MIDAVGAGPCGGGKGGEPFIMKREELPGLFRVGPRVIHSDDEFAHLQAIRTAGFTPWYVGTPSPTSLTEGRVALNAVAQAFPEFLHQARTQDGKVVGYSVTTPAYWGGAAQALSDLHYYNQALRFGRRQMTALSFAHRSA